MVQKNWVMGYEWVDIEKYKIVSLLDNLLDLVECGEIKPSVAEGIALNLTSEEGNDKINLLFNSFTIELSKFK